MTLNTLTIPFHKLKKKSTRKLGTYGDKKWDCFNKYAPIHSLYQNIKFTKANYIPHVLQMFNTEKKDQWLSLSDGISWRWVSLNILIDTLKQVYQTSSGM